MEESSEACVPLNKILSKIYINKDEDSCFKVIPPHVTSSIDGINKSFTKLAINSNVTKIEPDVIGKEKYAGNIQNIITAMGLVLIQPLLPDLLYLDTPLFLYDSNSNYTYLGKIDDIFGSVNKPMYTVYPTSDIINALNIGNKVYYLPNDPDTQFMRVERTVNNTFNVIKNK